MVDDSGQLYTIEGIAAAILMIFTAYLAVNTAVVYTPQDVHIIDMQLEQLGNDALVVLDTPPSESEKSPLQDYIERDKPEWFGNNFTRLMNATTSGNPDKIKYTATVYYRDIADPTNVRTHPFTNSTTSSRYYRENAVNVSRLVYVNDNPYDAIVDDQVVLLEVMVWRD